TTRSSARPAAASTNPSGATMTTRNRRSAQRKATAAAGAARRRAAVDAYARLLPLLARLRRRGLSFGRIAAKLNAKGHTTRTGKPWHAAQVWRALARVANEAGDENNCSGGTGRE